MKLQILFLLSILCFEPAKALDFKEGSYKIDETCKFSVNKNKNDVSEVRIDFRKEATKEHSFKSGYDIFYFDTKNQKIINSDKAFCPSKFEKVKSLDSRFVEITTKCGGLTSGQTKEAVYIYDTQFERFVFSYVHRKAAYKLDIDPKSKTHSGPIKKATDHFWCMADEKDITDFLKTYKNDLIPEEFAAQIARKISQSKIREAHLGFDYNFGKSPGTNTTR